MQKIEATSLAIALTDWFLEQVPDHPAAPTLEEAREVFSAELARLRKQQYNKNHRGKIEKEK